MFARFNSKGFVGLMSLKLWNRQYLILMRPLLANSIGCYVIMLMSGAVSSSVYIYLDLPFLSQNNQRSHVPVLSMRNQSFPTLDRYLYLLSLNFDLSVMN